MAVTIIRKNIGRHQNGVSLIDISLNQPITRPDASLETNHTKVAALGANGLKALNQLLAIFW